MGKVTGFRPMDSKARGRREPGGLRGREDWGTSQVPAPVVVAFAAVTAGRPEASALCEGHPDTE